MNLNLFFRKMVLFPRISPLVRINGSRLGTFTENGGSFKCCTALCQRRSDNTPQCNCRRWQPRRLFEILCVCCGTTFHVSLTAGMADKTPKEPGAAYATRIDPSKEEGLSKEQIHFIRQVELEQWKKKTHKLRTRNVVTGLAIGALVLGICILA